MIGTHNGFVIRPDLGFSWNKTSNTTSRCLWAKSCKYIFLVQKQAVSSRYSMCKPAENDLALIWTKTLRRSYSLGPKNKEHAAKHQRNRPIGCINRGRRYMHTSAGLRLRLLLFTEKTSSSVQRSVFGWRAPESTAFFFYEVLIRDMCRGLTAGRL